MSGILDSMMTKPQAFSPQSVSEYMALQLAKKLGDTDQLSKYLLLVERHALSIIEEAFTNTTAPRPEQENLARVFDEELAALIAKGDSDEL